jgi:hypothetical protein
MLRIEIPLGEGNFAMARLVLIKNLSQKPIQPSTLRRVEYLRRSVTATMKKLFPSPSPSAAVSSDANRSHCPTKEKHEDQEA